MHLLHQIAMHEISFVGKDRELARYRRRSWTLLEAELKALGEGPEFSTLWAKRPWEWVCVYLYIYICIYFCVIYIYISVCVLECQDFRGCPPDPLGRASRKTRGRNISSGVTTWYAPFCLVGRGTCLLFQHCANIRRAATYAYTSAIVTPLWQTSTLGSKESSVEHQNCPNKET